MVDRDLFAVLGPTLDECRAEIARFRVGSHQVAWTKTNVHGGREKVTDLDVGIERVVTAALADAWPDVPVVGEESFQPGGTTPGTCFYVDPIDGTQPLLDGSPYFSVAVCRVRDHVAEDGVIDLPGFDLRLGLRAGHPLRVAGRVEALPSFGPNSILMSPRQLGVQGAIGPMASHAIPTTTLKVVLVSLGRAGAAVYLADGDHGGAAPWDYAAAMLIADGCGCRCADERGAPLRREGAGVAVPGVLPGWSVVREPVAVAVAQALARWVP